MRTTPRLERIACVLIGAFAISSGVFRLGLMDRWCAAIEAAFLAGYIGAELINRATVGHTQKG